jgi:hypothetical protein
MAAVDLEKRGGASGGGSVATEEYTMSFGL